MGHKQSTGPKGFFVLAAARCWGWSPSAASCAIGLGTWPAGSPPRRGSQLRGLGLQPHPVRPLKLRKEERDGDALILDLA